MSNGFQTETHIAELEAEVERLRDENIEQDKEIQEYESAVVDYEKTIDTFRASLQEIKDTQGQVCGNFELCRHESCRSSYTSWAIADKVLKATGQK